MLTTLPSRAGPFGGAKCALRVLPHLVGKTPYTGFRRKRSYFIMGKVPRANETSEGDCSELVRGTARACGFPRSRE